MYVNVFKVVLRLSELSAKDKHYSGCVGDSTFKGDYKNQHRKHLNHTALSQSANLIMAEDTRQDKRASFSAITEHNTNGMARTSAMASGKSSASKKLVIKNFKGIVPDCFRVCYYLPAAVSQLSFTSSEE